MFVTTGDIAKLGTILGVWAHPDDESWCMAGILASARANGQRVVCITATKGDAGMTSDEARWPQARLAEIREKELEASLKILGVTEHYWLDYKDGQLKSADPEKAITEITEIIRQVNPDTIFSFGADGLTGHSDHQTIYQWTKLAIKKSDTKAAFYSVIELQEFYESAVCQACNKKFNIYFNVDRPKTTTLATADLVLELNPETQALKLRSLEAHACQMERFLTDPTGREFLVQLSRREAFMKELT